MRDYNSLSPNAQFLYHYSSYWGTWSRVLSIAGLYTIEVNLTPIRGSSTSTWEDHVAPIVIRKHATGISASDETRQPSLPVPIVNEMIKKLGTDLTCKLVLSPLLAEIDLDKLDREMKGGGVSLDMVRRES